MGNAGASRYVGGKKLKDYYKEILWPKHLKLLNKFHIEQSKGYSLFKIFAFLDSTRTEEIDIEDCIKYFGGRATNFIRRLYVYFLKSESEKFQFVSFTITLWNICTLTTKQLARYAGNINELIISNFLS